MILIIVKSLDLYIVIAACTMLAIVWFPTLPHMENKTQKKKKNVLFRVFIFRVRKGREPDYAGHGSFQSIK